MFEHIEACDGIEGAIGERQRLDIHIDLFCLDTTLSCDGHSGCRDIDARDTGNV